MAIIDTATSNYIKDTLYKYISLDNLLETKKMFMLYEYNLYLDELFGVRSACRKCSLGRAFTRLGIIRATKKEARNPWKKNYQMVFG